MAVLASRTLLLHVCCGPCASVTVPAWRAEGLEPVGLFCNPNVSPAAEYGRRLAAARLLATALAMRFEVAAPDAERLPAWQLGCGAQAPPSPGRCHECIGARLWRTAQLCAEMGLDRFATTLAVSPWQAHDAIREQGEAAADVWGVEFLYTDQRRLYGGVAEASRRLGLYRQPYCGCVPSKWEAWGRRQARRGRRRGAPG